MNKEKLSKTIIEHFNKISSGYDDLITTILFEDKICSIKLKKMYQGLGDLVSFENLTWLSKLLNTDKINLKDEFYNRGCDSCDYGSTQSVTIVCEDIKI